MVQSVKSVGAVFETDPGHACAQLAELLVSDKNLSAQVLDYILYQYSALTYHSLLDEHLPLIVDRVIRLPAASRQCAWSTLFSWVNHRASGRKIALLEASLMKGALLADNDWITARWGQLKQRSKTRLAINLSQQITALPYLPSLFPIGGVIIQALRCPRYSLGTNPALLMACLENLVLWGGREFCLSLQKEDRAFLSSLAQGRSLNAFPGLRSAATRFAINDSLKRVAPSSPDAPPVL